MLLFCRRMCHQLLLASNCFLSTSFLQTGLSISPRCYCDLLVNCTNHFSEECFVQFRQNVTQATFLHFCGTTEREIGFSILLIQLRA